MAQEKLIVKNFGPIKEAEIELGKVTVFIGEQASGKSVLAKLVSLFQSAEFLSSTISGKTTYKDIQEYFINYNIGEYFWGNTNIIYENDLYSISYISNEISYIIKKEVEENYQEIANPEFFNKLPDEIKLVFSFTSIIAVLANALAKRKTKEEDKELTNEDNSELKKFFELMYILVNNTYPLYFPAERQLVSILSDSVFDLTNTNTTLPKFIVDFGKVFIRAKKLNSFKNFEDLKISYHYDDDDTDYILYNNVKTKLGHSSSGLQSIIP
ncbi:MAG: AAA family ATPase, partial [Saprospiraceae bacterium]|nr:AAA family ATPase [Saprospiraceae bacterium]